MNSCFYALTIAAMLAAGAGPAMSDQVKKQGGFGSARGVTKRATSSSLTAIAKVSTASIRRAC